jgi:lipoate-protein ligase A
MAKYRTAQGKVVDMAQLATKNERTRAVGNMSVNARGDTIDGTGKIILPVTKKTGDRYQRTVSNRAANLVQRKQKDELSESIAETKVDLVEELTAEELEFLNTEEEDNEIEAIKAAKALEATRAEEIKKKIRVKPASEAPDTFDPSKD